MFRGVKQILSRHSPYRSQEVRYDRRVIDDRRVTPPDTCGTEDEPNMWFRSSEEPPAVRK